MDSYNLVVLDGTEIFAARLRAQLREIRAEMEVFWADGPEAVNDIIANHSPHAYLISAEWRKRGVRVDTGAARIISLEEKRGEGAQDAPEAIYREDPMAQSAAQLVRMLLRRTRVIGVFGVCGGAGNTTACMALARGFAQRGARVFALGLEPCIAEPPFSGPGDVGLAEVLLAMDSGANMERAIAGACYQSGRYENIDAFAVNEYNADRTELRPGDAQKLIAAMRRMNRWDVILVDLESRMNDLLFEVWQSAAKMVMMIPQTAIGREKLRKAERDLEMREKRGEAELDKLVPVLNFTISADRSFSVLGRPVQLAVPQVKPEQQVRAMSSRQWCQLLGSDQGRPLFEAVLREVSQ